MGSRGIDLVHESTTELVDDSWWNDWGNLQTVAGQFSRFVLTISVVVTRDHTDTTSFAISCNNVIIANFIDLDILDIQSNNIRGEIFYVYLLYIKMWE